MSERLNEQNFTKLYADKMACDGMCSSHRKQPEKGGQKKGEGGSERKAEGNGGILYSCDFSSGFSAFTVT